jgi:leader peptidase (prepilin peptidase)/N-methyltransferase
VTPELPNWGNPPILVAYAGLLGAAIGSFLNVCILRWGAEPKQSVVRPASRCPRCGQGLRWYDNFPIVSWLVLRGRCRGCRQPISPMYPLIEFATALVWAFMAWRSGFGLEALRGAVFVTILLGIAMTDARAYIIPHELSVGGAVLAVGLALVAGTDAPTPGGALLGACFGAGLVLLAGELSEMLLGQEAMGGGDCALMGMVGAFCGWEAVLPVIGAGAAISVVLYAAASVRSLRPGRQSPAGATSLPEAGPSLRLGMLMKLLAGGAVLLAGLVVAMQLGTFVNLIRAVFDGVVGAGVIYYASLLAPAGLHGRWIRVAGLLGAAAGVAVGGGLSPIHVAAGAVLAAASLWYARGASVTASPETTEELSAQGYLPFGVGLSLAAGVLELAGAYPGIRVAAAGYLQGIGAL